MSELEQRVARAADEAWLEGSGDRARYARPVYPRDIIRDYCVPAALKAHAEWLESKMEKMCAAANDARLADPEEAEGIFRTMISAAQEEQP